VHCKGDDILKTEPLNDLLTRLDLGGKPRPNTSNPVNMDRLNGLRADVVSAVKAEVLTERMKFDAEIAPKLKQQLDELSRLKTKQITQLELGLESSKQEQTFKDGKRHKNLVKINDTFGAYQAWIEDTMQTEPAPYIQIIAVLAKSRDD
jgi:hypothetical protein